MATILKDSLQTIQTHRALSPHYTELLDILEEIMILREEYRRRIQRETFPVDEKLIPAKMAGGFPLPNPSAIFWPCWKSRKRGRPAKPMKWQGRSSREKSVSTT
jgi:hypothetical protein